MKSTQSKVPAWVYMHHTCRICKQSDSDVQINYAPRHWSHDECWLKAGRDFFSLAGSEQGKFRVRVLRDFGILDMAKTQPQIDREKAAEERLTRHQKALLNSYRNRYAQAKQNMERTASMGIKNYCADKMAEMKAKIDSLLKPKKVYRIKLLSRDLYKKDGACGQVAYWLGEPPSKGFRLISAEAIKGQGSNEPYSWRVLLHIERDTLPRLGSSDWQYVEIKTGLI